MKKAVITGIYGQDGSFLAEYLLKEGYQVYGFVRTPLGVNSQRIKDELGELHQRISVYENVLLDYEQLKQILIEIEPDEIYHLSAVHASSEKLNLTNEKMAFENNIKITANLLDICYNWIPNCHIVTAGSCLMFDGSGTQEQTEDTPFSSNSYYGIAKITENMLVKMYRNKGLFACTAILYNHESHRRAVDFVTRKIVSNMVKVRKGIISSFALGNLDALKDWGYAPDYIRGMVLMANNTEPKDYILATNVLHTIRDFVEECARQLDISDWEQHVQIDSGIITRKVATRLKGDCSMAEKELGWNRTKTFEEMIVEMIEKELLGSGMY